MGMSGRLLRPRATGYIPAGMAVGWRINSVAVSGGKITQWNDITGGGNHLTNSTSAEQWTYDAAAGRPPSGAKGYAITSPITIDWRNATIAIFHPRIAAATAPGQTIEVMFQTTSNGLYKQGAYWDVGAFGNLFYDTTMSSSVIVYSSSAITTYCDTATYTSAAGSATPQSITRAFSTGTSTFPWKREVAALYVWNRQLSAAEVAALKAAMRQVDNKPITLTTLGDSITAGMLQTNADAWPSQVADAAGYRLLNLGQGGEFASQAVVRSNRNGMKTASRRTILVVALGTNDLLNAGAVATLQTNITTICNEWRTAYTNSANLRILVASVLPATSGFNGGQTSGGFETDRLAYRTWLLANYSGFADGVLDIGDPATALGNVANVGTYMSDGIHPNAAGYALYGAAAKAAVSALNYT
jgi:lysophospholipase L1-like esterase